MDVDLVIRVSAFQEQGPKAAGSLELKFDREGFPNQRYGEVLAQISGDLLEQRDLANRVANFAAQTAIRKLSGYGRELTLSLQHQDQFLTGVCSLGAGAELRVLDNGRKIAQEPTDLIAAYLIAENIKHNFALRVFLPECEEPLSMLEFSPAQVLQPVFLVGSGKVISGIEFSSFELSSLLPGQCGKFGPYCALFCRTQFGDIVGVFPPQGMYPELQSVAVGAYESRRAGCFAAHPLSERDFKSGQAALGAPFKLGERFKTSPLSEIVAARVEPSFGRDVAVAQVSQIRLQFEQMIGLE